MIYRYFLILILFFSIPLSSRAVDYIDSLETRLILVDNSEKLLILDEIIPYYFRNRPLHANKRASKMLGIAITENNKQYKIKAQRYIGLSNSLLTSSHEEALDLCRKAEINAKSNGFIEELILTKLAYADIYQQIGDYTKSLEYQIEAFHMADSMDYFHLISIVLNNQAKSYLNLDDHDKTEECLKKSLKNAKIHGQQEIVAETNIIFGDLFEQSFHHELALLHYKKAHEIYLNLKNDIQFAITLYKIGDCYFSMDQLDTAFQYQLKSLAIRTSINDGTGLAESYNKIGQLCIENSEFQRALDNLKLGLFNAELVNSNILMQESFDFLYQACLGMDDYKNALYYQNKYTGISELIYGEASEKRIDEINAKNEINKREQEIENLMLLSEKREQQLSTSRKFNLTLALLLIVIIISTFFIIRSYREKRQFNKELQRINAQVVDQNIELTELNSTKDKFFSIIGHDLKGPLNSLTSFSQLLINHTASLSEEEIREIARDLDESLKNLYELLENLLGWARSQTGRIDFNPEDFSVAKVISENIGLLSKAAKNKNVRIEAEVDDDIEVFADINSVKTVMRNLLSNAIKFTPSGGVISIYTDELNDYIKVGISDNGVGLSEEDQQKIFDISAKHSTLGTNKEKGTGLGLILCKEFVEKNHGKIGVTSKKGAGATFSFTIPKHKNAEKKSPIYNLG